MHFSYKFYINECILFQDYTCPRCCSGFIEALDGSSPAGDQGDDSEDDFDVVQPWEVSTFLYSSF